MNREPTKPKRKIVTLKHHTYQPNKAELDADIRAPGTFKEAVGALTKPVEIRHERRIKTD